MTLEPVPERRRRLLTVDTHPDDPTDGAASAVARSTLPLVPVACTLAAGELAGRGREWEDLLARALLARRATAGGVELWLRDLPGVAATARRLAEAERSCCPWFVTTVTQDTSAGARAVVVSMQAHDGQGAATLAAMFTHPDLEGG